VTTAVTTAGSTTRSAGGKQKADTLILDKHGIGIKYWFVLRWDRLINAEGKTRGIQLRFRWIKWSQRQWNLEIKKVYPYK
jgi:hypothetical protein